MKKRFIITETEKINIRKMYGLIKEGREQIQEVELYSTEYINKDGCDGIATDVNNLSAAVNRGEVNLSSSGKASLEENKGKVGMIKDWNCGIVKNQMKKALESELNDESKYPDAIATACWMSKNSVRHTKNLSICTAQPPVQNQNNQDKNNPDQSLNNNPQFVPQTMQNTRTPQSQPSNSNSLEGLIQSRQQASSGRKLEF